MATLRLALIGLLLCGLTFHLTEACGWTTTALNGTVQSPNFPGNYPNNQSCVYIITAPEGYQVTLNFTDLDIDPTSNCSTDFLEIREGDSQSSPLIRRYCNQTVPRRRRTFGNQMWIKFVSDGNTTAQGFRATFVSANLQAPYFLIAGYVGNGVTGIYRMDVETTTYYTLLLIRSSYYTIAVDFDPVEQTIYWVQRWSNPQIQASFINGSRAQTILTSGSYIGCLAVDPLSRLVFYCDNSRDRISMVTMTTMAHKTILTTSSVMNPEFIVLNTAEGVMFWIAYGRHNRIERANYDGSDMRTVVNESSWIIGLAVDVSNKRLYWAVDSPNQLKMSDLEGKEQSVLFTTWDYHHYFQRIELFNNILYFTSYYDNGYSLFRWDIGSPNYTVVGRISFDVDDFCIVQPGLFSDMELNGCGTNNGGCDSICIPLPNNGSKCMCPDGQALTRNQTSCVDACPENYWGYNCSQTCNCSKRAMCHVLKGCVCDSGWSGVTCSTDVNECEGMTKVCPENQICQNNPGSFVCLCHPGFLKVSDNQCVEHTRFLDFGSQQGDSTLPKGRQKLSAEVSVPSGLPIAGKIVTEAFVSMNGLISFGKKYDSFSARTLPVAGFDLMCGYWTDMQLPTTEDTANVWYQVYRRRENSTAGDLAMLTMGGKKVEQHANISSYLPVFMLVVTFENVPLDGASTDMTEKVTFQMSVVSDGFTTYGLVTYAANGTQVDSRLGRPVTIGYLSTNIDIASPDTDTGNTGYPGVWFYTLSTEVNNSAQHCLNWYYGQLSQVSQYRQARFYLAACPCIKSVADISSTLLAEEVKDDVACFLSAPVISGQQYAQRCCYNQTTGSFLQIRPLAGSFLRFHPTVNARGHSLMDTLPKQYCCQHSQLCDKYYQVRPISTCQHITIRQAMGTGDPHLTTLDGKTFSFNAVGEFTLLRFNTPRFELQARTCVATSSKGATVAASVFCAFAAKGANSTFQVEMNRNKTGLNVNVDREDLSKKFQTEASFSRTFSGLTVARTQDSAVKAFFMEDIGLTVRVKHRQLTIHITVHFNTTDSSPSGLLGNLNGDPQDDFIFPNGTTLPGNASEQDLLDYGKSWAINSDSLFVYEGGWNTSHYADENFQPLFLSDIPGQKLAEAQRECGDTEDLSCIYDFFATDDKDLAKGTKEANDQLKVNIKIAGNRAPTLTGPAQIEVILGQSVSVTFSAKDEDDVTGPKYVIIQQPQGFTFNEATETAQFTPGSNNMYSIELSVEDSNGAMSPSFRVSIVQCSGCSDHGDCNFTKLRSTGEEYFQWATCDCLPYYEGEDCEADLDACEDDPCPLQISCTDLAIQEHMAAGPSSPGYKCGDCPDGYLWRLSGATITCQDIDECHSSPPPCQHFCTNIMGSYRCSCKPGYRKDVADGSLCRDINECQESTHDCNHQCVNTEGSYHCTCFPGFALTTTDKHTCVRETAADPCMAQSPPCSYACQKDSGGIRCLCPAGYVLAADHRTCEDVNECQLNLCSQKCDNSDGSFTCSCYAGFQLDADKVTCNACPAYHWGDNCSQTCDCRGRGKCNQVKGCVCDSGWSGVTCSIDVNECETVLNACPANQICENVPGSFVCLCPTGFRKVNSRLCADIDECAVSSNHTCQQVCVNTPGSYVCSCHEGYTYDAGNNTCVDIDECVTNTANCEYQCENFPGTANCLCGPGFVLNDDRRTCTKEEDPCKLLWSSKNCSYACQVVNGYPDCYCAAGFQLATDGKSCHDINECSGNHSCDQVCHNTAGNYRCSCSTGYTLGSDQRTCVVCDRNHWGDNCNMTCDCNPLGTQRCDRVTGCVCRSGWQGAQCQQDIDECVRAPCSSLLNSRCVNTAGSFRCLCGDGYVMNAEGGACVDINECQQQSSPCDQNCTNTEGSYLCSCQHGFRANGPACVDLNKETDSAAVSSTVIAVASAVSVLVIGIIIVIVVIIVLRRRKTKTSERTQLQKDNMYIDLGSSGSKPSEVQTSL